MDPLRPQLRRPAPYRHPHAIPRDRRAPTDLWDDLITSEWTPPADRDTQVDIPLQVDRDLLEPSRRKSGDALSARTEPPRAVTALEPFAWVATRRRPRPWPLYLCVAATAATCLLAAAPRLSLGGRGPEPMLLAYDGSAADSPQAPRMSFVATAAPETSRAIHWRSAPYRDLWRESDWHHPLEGPDRLLPERSSREFGAERPGVRPGECLGGHCGVDLGERGLTVIATRDGVIEVARRRARGKTGRYVRIAHGDGFVTYYLHLQRIRPDLRRGMKIAAGEPIGTVGRTGIRNSAAHLHFALVLRKGRRKIFIDPEPLLRRSTVKDGSKLVRELVRSGAPKEL